MANNSNNQFNKFELTFLIVSAIFFSICLIAPKVREHRSKVEQARIEEARELKRQRHIEQFQREQEERRIRDSIEAPLRRVREFAGGLT